MVPITLWFAMELRDRAAQDRVEGEPGASKRIARALAPPISLVAAHARKGRCRGELTHISREELPTLESWLCGRASVSQAATAAMSATLVYVRVIAASRVLREGAGAGIWVVPTMEAETSKWRGMCDGGAALKHHRPPPPSLPLWLGPAATAI